MSKLRNPTEFRAGVSCEAMWGVTPDQDEAAADPGAAAPPPLQPALGLAGGGCGKSKS